MLLVGYGTYRGFEFYRYPNGPQLRALPRPEHQARLALHKGLEPRIGRSRRQPNGDPAFEVRLVAHDATVGGQGMELRCVRTLIVQEELV